MFRKFKFEEPVYRRSNYVPLATRYKLDVLGIRLPKNSWPRLLEEEREVLCHLPIRSQGEKDCYRRYVSHLLGRNGDMAEFLDPVEIQRERDQWENPILIPVHVHRLMKEHNVHLGEQDWLKMDDLERYVLFKIAKEKELSLFFTEALKELRDHPKPRRFMPKAS